MKTIQMFLFLLGLLVVKTAEAQTDPPEEHAPVAIRDSADAEQCTNDQCVGNGGMLREGSCACSYQFVRCYNERDRPAGSDARFYRFCHGRQSSTERVTVMLVGPGRCGCESANAEPFLCQPVSGARYYSDIERGFQDCELRARYQILTPVLARARVSGADIARLGGYQITEASCEFAQCQWVETETAALCDCSTSSIVSQAIAVQGTPQGAADAEATVAERAAADAARREAHETAQRELESYTRTGGDPARIEGWDRVKCLTLEDAGCRWIETSGFGGHCNCARNSSVVAILLAGVAVQPASPPPPTEQAAAPTPAEPEPHPTPVGSGLVPDRGEQHGGGEPLALQTAEPPPASPLPPASPPLAPPPQGGETDHGADLCSRVRECGISQEIEVMDERVTEVYSLAEQALGLVHLGVNLGGFWFATERIETDGVSVGASLMLGLGVYDLEFDLRGGYVAWSNSAFVGVEFAYVPKVSDDLQLDFRGGTMWAPLAFHTGSDQTRTPRAETFGGTAYLGFRHEWFGAGLRGFVGMGESEGPTRGFAHGGELVLSVILGR